MPKQVSRCQKKIDPHWTPPKDFEKEVRTILEDWMLIEAVAWVQSFRQGVYSRAIYIQEYLSDRFGYTVDLETLIDRLNRLDGVVLYRHCIPSYGRTYTEYWIHPDWQRKPFNRFYMPEERDRLKEIISENARKTEEYRLERNAKKREYDKRKREERKQERIYTKALETVEDARTKAKNKVGTLPRIRFRSASEDYIQMLMKEEPDRVLYLDTSELETYGDVVEIVIYDGNGILCYAKHFGTYDTDMTATKGRNYSLGGVSFDEIKGLTPLLECDQEREKLTNLFLSAKLIVGYSVEYDIDLLRESGIYFGEEVHTLDLMKAYAKVYNDYSEYFQDYVYQPLKSAVKRYVKVGEVSEGGSFLAQCVRAFPIIQRGIESEKV